MGTSIFGRFAGAGFHDHDASFPLTFNTDSEPSSQNITPLIAPRSKLPKSLVLFLSGAFQVPHHSLEEHVFTIFLYLTFIDP